MEWVLDAYVHRVPFHIIRKETCGMKRIMMFAVLAVVFAGLSCSDKNIDVGLELLEKNEYELAMLRFTNVANKEPENVSAFYYSAIGILLYEDFVEAQKYGDKLFALHSAQNQKSYAYGITDKKIEALGLVLAAKNGKDSVYAQARPDLVAALQELRETPHKLLNTGAAAVLGSWMFKWKFETAGRIMGAPLVLAEKVVITSGAGIMYCVHPEDGTFLWSYDGADRPYFNNGPFAVGSRMFAVCYDTLYEMNPDKGRLKTRYPDISTKPAIIGNEAYAVFSPSLVRPEDTPYYIIKRQVLGRKKTVWERRVDGEFSFTTPLVAQGKVFVQASDNFYCLNQKNGKSIWTFKIHTGSYPQAIALEGDNVIFGADKMLYCLNSNTGEVKWKYKAGGNIESSPIVNGKNIYFGSNDARVYAVKLTDGTLVWRYKTYGRVVATPAVTETAVYAASEDGHLYALNRITGLINWKYMLGRSVVSSPQVKNGVIFVGCTDNLLYALNEKLTP